MHKTTLNFTKINLLVLNLIELYDLTYKPTDYKTVIYIVLSGNSFEDHIGRQRANANIVLSNKNSDIHLSQNLYNGPF